MEYKFRSSKNDLANIPSNNSVINKFIEFDEQEYDNQLVLIKNRIQQLRKFDNYEEMRKELSNCKGSFLLNMMRQKQFRQHFEKFMKFLNQYKYEKRREERRYSIEHEKKISKDKFVLKVTAPETKERGEEKKVS